MKKQISHSGVLGMHWGVRQGRSSGGNSSKPSSADHTKAVALKTKKLSEMSNEELKALTTRMQLEKQFKDLSRKDVSAGEKFVTDIVSNSTKQIISSFLADQGKKAIVTLIKTATG